MPEWRVSTAFACRLTPLNAYRNFAQKIGIRVIFCKEWVAPTKANSIQ